MSDIPPDKFEVLALQEILTNYSPDIVLHLPDGTLSFIYRLVVEQVRDCLTKYDQGHISSEYLEHLQKNIRTLVQQAEEKSTSGELAFFKELAQSVLCVLERPAHLPEHLESSEGDSEDGQSLRISDSNISQLELNTDLMEEISVPAINDGGICENPEIQESTNAVMTSLNLGRNPCKTDYEQIKLISSGGFGAVHLVRHKDTKRIFAMKKLDKQNLKNPKKLERAFLERDILTFADCPFVAAMFCSFPSKHHLCMVMEYVPGGDCSSLMGIYGRLPVPLARTYIAETVLAVEYLHSFGVVHRDLKPENLLVAANGHIKVTDFGLSKLGLMRPSSDAYKAPIEDIIREFIDLEIGGTPNYIAPEVILMVGYGRPVDWWSVGVILYEFLLGRLPFIGESKEKIYCSVVIDEITWTFDNSSPPSDAQDFIIELLRKNPAHRLGTGGADEIKIHPFLQIVDFDNILSKEPQFVPDLKTDEDTSYFDTRCRIHKHMDSDEGDTSEDNYLTENQNFLSSSQRLFKLCSTNTRMTNNEKPESPPGCSPESKNHSDMQRESSLSKSEEDNECFPAIDSESSPVTEFPVQQKTKNMKTGESKERRRGSIFRRVISSCRRGFSRAAHAIRAVGHRGSINIARAERHNLAP